MRFNRFIMIWIVLLALLASAGFTAQPTQAGNFTLLNNSGSTSSNWVIEGEPTLIMNGFDLTPLGLTFPITLDAVTIALNQTVPDIPVQVVVYEDSNGGSPADARLVSQTEVFLQSTGVARVDLPQAAVINAPVVWVGFYLQPGFRFWADEQGSSVLSYWGWSSGTTFDLSNLASAEILGPSDGSAPVNINMGGVARITAEINTGFGSGTNQAGVPIGTQIEGDTGERLALMDLYPYCGDRVLYDTQDLRVTANAAFTMHCRADLGPYSPGTFINADQLPAPSSEWERRGVLYEVFAAGDYQTASGNSELLRVPVTHCMRPEQSELNTAVIGIGYGAPREWEILPSQRYGEWICAEVTHQGFLSYFVPRTGGEANLNADLYFSGFAYLEGINDNNDGNLRCGYRYIVHYSVHNEGFEATPESNVTLQFINDRTGTISREYNYVLPPVLPGDTANFAQLNFVTPSTFINEAHTLVLRIDTGNVVSESNEGNNTYSRTGFFVTGIIGGCP
ncbi:MAG: CARDB domain-containing protein [Anaerolineae bacterium]|nr:CARDB domain-containing protein [Anaerolineae bacterium]MDQ7034410.1 CARDB domain-containing protein [Anaerolineae bacterium]